MRRISSPSLLVSLEDDVRIVFVDSADALFTRKPSGEGTIDNSTVFSASNGDLWIKSAGTGSPTLETVATPTFSPASGDVLSGATVTITCATSGATIRYTTNGVDPTSTSGTVYSSPVAISAGVTLKAMAYKSGSNDSAIRSAAFTVASNYDVQYGVSASDTLDLAGIEGLAGRKMSPVAGNYSFSPGSPEKYLFIAIEATELMPRATDGFVTGGLPMGGDLAGAAQGFDQVVNGWPYLNVTGNGGETLRLFRTLYKQGSDFTITLNT